MELRKLQSTDWIGFCGVFLTFHLIRISISMNTKSD